MNAIDGIFFDLDGTLVDTAEDFVFTINLMLREHKLPPVEPEQIRRNVSTGSSFLMQMAFNLPPGEKLQQKREEFLNYYDQHIRNEQRDTFSTLYPGIKELLGELEHRQLAWGIVTNKPRKYALLILEQLGILDRSHTLVCPDDVKYAKPDPEALLLACKQTRCAPEKSIYIGDHLRDIEAGRQAGMHTVAARYGYIAEDDDPCRWQADLNVDNARELHDWLINCDWKLPE